MNVNRIRRALRDAVARSKWLTCAAFVADGLLAQAGLFADGFAPEEHLGGVHLDRDLAYARMVAARYRENGLSGARVAELGPGGSAAVALCLIDSGAQSVDLADRFRFAHDPAALGKCYAAILAASPRLTALFPDGEIASRVRSYSGPSFAAERFFAGRAECYDAICSNMVLGVVRDPLAALRDAARALAPGGTMVHGIDLRDHLMFTRGGYDPLEFLTLPAWLWPWLSRARGWPNRVPLAAYRETLAALPLDWSIEVTTLVAAGDVEPAPYAEIEPGLRARAEAHVERMRPRLAAPFRDLAASDLAVSGFIIRASKPAGVGTSMRR